MANEMKLGKKEREKSKAKDPKLMMSAWKLWTRHSLVLSSCFFLFLMDFSLSNRVSSSLYLPVSLVNAIYNHSDKTSVSIGI